jgi:hypothetical protein
MEKGIEILNRYCGSLDEIRNNRLGLRRVSVSADTIRARATHREVPFDVIRDTDLILHVLLQLRGERYEWFPRTSVYGGRFSKIDFFSRLVSRSYFEKVKALFEIQTVEELRTLIELCVARNNANQLNYSIPWEYNIPRVENMIEVQRVATSR